MLTPVTPNPIATSATIKSHGSEARTAAGHNIAESGMPAQTQGHTHGIGLDAGTILANVNAEAATAGNRTILQTLALAVAAQLNLSRRDDETMEAFFQRIASALDDMAPDEQAALEIRAGLKLLRIEIPALAAALKQPDSALAARLVATAETPLATPLKTTAATVTTNYLQDAPGVSRAAETLAMVAQAHSNTEGSGIFSSAPAAPKPEPPLADARSLQSQLKSLFEPGVAETRMEIARKAEAAVAEMQQSGPADGLQEGANGASAVDDGEAGNPGAGRMAGGNEPAREQGPLQLPMARRFIRRQPDDGQAGFGSPEAMPNDTERLETRSAETRQMPVRPAQMRQANSELVLAGGKSASASQEPEAHAEQKAQALPVPQNNNTASASQRLHAIAREIVQQADARTGRQDDGDHRMQTMLTLKGLAEVITALPSKATEFLTNAPANTEAHVADRQQKAAPAPMPHIAEGSAENAAQAASPETPVRKDGTAFHRPAPGTDTVEGSEADARASGHPAGGEQQPAVRPADMHQAIGIRAGMNGSEPVPFGYVALQPAKEEFKAEAAEERGRHADDDQEREEQEPEDQEARRERLARKATDDLLRPEPESGPDLKITRDSSQADRAYALYQRMAGF